MNAVGRLGSYLSRGMYTVSAPFHPFGGAVDIVVVEQPDGSFRSSPWYVRFGKFQGVLKSKEKIVKIMVNGVEADLFMYLNNCGQSYFSKEADDDEYAKYGDEVVIRPSSFFEQMKSHHDPRRTTKSRSCDFGDPPTTFGRFNSLDSADIAAQLLEVQWSTSLTTKGCKDKSEVSHFSAPCSPRGNTSNRDMLVIDEIVDDNYYKGSESFPEDRLSLSSTCSDDADVSSVLSNGSGNDGDQVPRQSLEVLKPINGERKQNVDCGKVKSVDNLSQSVDPNAKSVNLPLPNNDTEGSTKSFADKESQIVQNQSNCEGNVNNSEEQEAHLLNQEETKKMLKVLTPSSEQVASLDLKEGSNTVTFTFSTSMLGDQQVEARIYLWKWDNKIIVSDVDGTITKSDVLGQCMPLVGIDWSQAGVARLFSAIRENGYRLLFLSARSISQASVTRQFLLNLKQDGLPLPDGPVVISPDGLFPSLYREVIKRVPHEFKIACLEDIKALFPSECNPFYAGFGNRDTDEISYLKVGIPKGKIFIINPKGEVVVNRHVHAKSYTSIHTLVNDMFPPITSSEHEQEDFNSWNFWKLPPPTL